MSENPRGGSTGGVGCALTLTLATPAELVVQVAAARRAGRRVDDRLDVSPGDGSAEMVEVVDGAGGRQHVVRAGPGSLRIVYEAVVVPTGEPAGEPVTDAQRVIGLRPSRYCPSDRLAGFAGRRFGAAESAEAKVAAICDYVWNHVVYDAEATPVGADAIETLASGRGVCRDFAHLVLTLCRAVGVPARLAAVYAPGLSPMDFHAVVETAIDGRWWCWDATRLAPRQSLVRIATGRDAADAAFLTVLSGLVDLSTVEVTAVAPGRLPLDDHERGVVLG
jgi:transglutaminase-like putative cysteine protease